MLKLSVAVDQSWSRANERAVEAAKRGLRPVRSAAGHYTCPSAHGGESYVVTILNVGSLSATCTCEHGRSGRAGHCWHVAAALAAEIQRVSRPVPVSIAPVALPAERAARADAFAARFARQ